MLFIWSKICRSHRTSSLRLLESQEFITPRQVRWLERISEFDFEIVPVKEKSNTMADDLCRQPSRTNEKQEYSKELSRKLMSETTFIGALSMLVLNKSLVKTINEAYKKDPDFKEIIRKLKEPFEIRDGMLYPESKLFIPQREIRNKLLHDYHSTPSTGCLGESKTRNPILPKY